MRLRGDRPLQIHYLTIKLHIQVIILIMDTDILDMDMAATNMDMMATIEVVATILTQVMLQENCVILILTHQLTATFPQSEDRNTHFRAESIPEDYPHQPADQ